MQMSHRWMVVKQRFRPRFFFLPCCFVSSASSRDCQGLSNQGWLHEAIVSSKMMQQQGMRIPKDTVLGLVRECTKLQDLEASRQVYNLMVYNSLDSVSLLSDHLIRQFGAYGSLVEANQSFSKVVDPSRYTWNTIITAHAKLGKNEMALQFYDEIQREGSRADKYIFLSTLKACSRISGIEQTRNIHEQIINIGIGCDVVVGTTLVDLYAKFGNLEEARNIFDRLPHRNLMTWNAMIGGYAQNGEGFLALDCHEKMQGNSLHSDKVTFLNVLKGCGSICAIEHGRCIHEQVIQAGLQSDIVVGTTLTDMYGKCEKVEEAHRIFDTLPSPDVVAWNAMIAGYVQCGHNAAALECLENMQQKGIKPCKVTFITILKACSTMDTIEQGRYFHKQIVDSGFEHDIVLGNTLVSMYSKHGRFEEAYKIFDQIVKPNVVAWSALIEGYAMHGEGLLALRCFEDMQHEGIEPCKVTFLSTLKACSSIGAIEQGRQVHEQIKAKGLQSDINIGNTLIDMYARCGDLDQACLVFERLSSRNVVTWNAIILGHAQSGNVSSAEKCLKDMQQEGIRPNEVTFATILGACGHAGLVDDGCKHFKSMKEDHNITPDGYHCACVVDLLGRAGHLEKAENLLHTVQSDIGWRTLLAACRTYGHVELGRRCFNQVVPLDPYHAGAYVLMSGIYSDSGLWEEALRIDELRQHACAWKKPAKAWIEVDKKVHEFVVGEKSHPQIEEICTMLKTLNSRMKEAGYTPNHNLVLQQISNEEKEDVLCGHCEKLAIAFGIISTPPGTTIRATKNLRVCMDCHNASKVISKIERREIIIKDAYRMHHFIDGACSCVDYN